MTFSVRGGAIGTGIKALIMSFQAKMLSNSFSDVCLMLNLNFFQFYIILSHLTSELMRFFLSITTSLEI
jgi:hypothetical protein